MHAMPVRLQVEMEVRVGAKGGLVQEVDATVMEVVVVLVVMADNWLLL